MSNILSSIPIASPSCELFDTIFLYEAFGSIPNSPFAPGPVVCPLIAINRYLVIPSQPSRGYAGWSSLHATLTPSVPLIAVSIPQAEGTRGS